MARHLSILSSKAFRSNGGNVAIIFAVSMPLVVGGAGLGVETTFWRFKQMQLQEAADAATYAAALEKRRGSGDTAVRAAAQTAANAHGFPSTTTTLALTYPTSVGGVAVTNAVKVALQTTAPRFFSGYFNDGPVTVKSEAVANYTNTGASCILALDPAASGALKVWGSAQLTLTSCSMMSNSISDTAVMTGGTSKTTAPCIISAGGVSLASTVVLTSCAASITEAAVAVDPYKTLAAPTKGTNRTDGSASLAEGYYANGIKITSDTVLTGGTYYVGKTFQVNANTKLTNTAGTGVTIYLSEGATVSINGTATVQLNAPTTGTYKGILFFGDRTAAFAKNNFNGTADSWLTGSIYFPSQEVDYAGNYSGQNGCTQVVAKMIEWTGNTNMKVNCASAGMTDVPVLGDIRLIG